MPHGFARTAVGAVPSNFSSFPDTSRLKLYQSTSNPFDLTNLVLFYGCVSLWISNTYALRQYLSRSGIRFFEACLLVIFGCAL